MWSADLADARWVKSSRSANNGTCVEVAAVPGPWVKSSRSSNNGACVEVAEMHARVAARDSKNPHGPALAFARPHWGSFLRAIKDGAFEAH